MPLLQLTWIVDVYLNCTHSLTGLYHLGIQQSNMLANNELSLNTHTFLLE